MQALERETFTTPRTMDFVSRKELTTQTGHDPSEWPQVNTKELLDNALDGCEDKAKNKRVAPELTIKFDHCSIEVTDDRPGLPAPTLKGACDFTVRCSSRGMYVSPDLSPQEMLF